MPPERLAADDPREWMNRARSNFLQAQGYRPGIYLEDLCFQAQQAAEKAIKALLIQRQIRFPYSHDLAVLIGLAEESGYSVPEPIRDAARLTQYAVMARYPSMAEPVTQEEYQEALALATSVLDWVEAALD